MGLVPHLSDRLHTFGLGLSTQLEHEDILEFLSRLPSLKTLVLSYHSVCVNIISAHEHPPKTGHGGTDFMNFSFFLCSPSLPFQQTIATKIPPLPKLTNFTVRVCPNIRYSSITTRQDVDQFCKWARVVIASSSLETISFQLLNNSQRLSTSFHPIVDHLVARHAKTLKVMDLSQCFVGDERLEAICNSCKKLRTLAVAGRKKTLVCVYAPYEIDFLALLQLMYCAFDVQDAFKRFSKRLPHLESFTMNILMVNSSKRKPFTVEEAESIFQETPASFKRLTIDGRIFEVSNTMSIER